MTNNDPCNHRPVLQAYCQPDPKQAIKKGTGTTLRVNAYPTVVQCSEPWGIFGDNWAFSGAISTVCALVVPALEDLGQYEEYQEQDAQTLAPCQLTSMPFWVTLVNKRVVSGEGNRMRCTHGYTFTQICIPACSHILHICTLYTHLCAPPLKYHEHSDTFLILKSPLGQVGTPPPGFGGPRWPQQARYH